MPWCPKCRNEYREGIEVCADCKVPLVATYEDIILDENAFVPLFSSEKKELLERFISYLDYSGIKQYTLTPDDYELIWTVKVCENKLAEAKKLYTGFAIAEKERAAAEALKALQEDTTTTEADSSQNEASDSETESIDYSPESDEFIEFDDFADDMINSSDEESLKDTLFKDNDTSENDELSDELSEIAREKIAEDDLMDEIHGASNAYVRKADQYKDYQFSAITCLFCGAVGVIFCILNMVGILTILPATFSQIVMLGVFALFLIAGIFILIKSTQIKTQIDEQVDVEGQVTVWLDTNITLDYLDTIKDEDVADEINYFNYSEAVRKWLLEDLPYVDEAMAEAMIEEHFNKLL